MLDLGLRANEHNGEIAQDILGALQERGLLLISGNSYHFYADRLTDWGGFVAFAARAALLSPLVDARWVLHQIVEGRGALRLSGNTGRGDQPPRAISGW